MQKLQSFFASSIQVVFSFLWAGVSLLIVADAAKNYMNIANFSVAWVLLFLLLLAAVTIGMLFLARLPKLKALLQKYPIRVLTLSMLFVLVLQLFLVRMTYTPIGWDVGSIISVAGNLHPELSEYYDTYLTWYPNNILMTAIFKVFCRIMQIVGMNPWLASVCLSVLAVDAGILFSCFIAKKVFGLKTFYLTLWISLLIAAFHPTITVPYSDTLAFPFTAAFLFLVVSAATAKRSAVRYSYCAFAGLAFILGYYIKPTVAIAGIALALWLFFCIRKPSKKNVLRTCSCVALALIGLGIGWGINQLAKPLAYTQVPTAERQEALEVPMTHFLMMGLNEKQDPKSYGFFQEDVNNTLAIAGVDEKAAFHKEVIRERITAFGIGGLLQHWGNKLIWVTTDGTFFYGGEGIFHAGTPMAQEGLKSVLQQWNYAETSVYQKYLTNFMQAVWLGIAIGMVLQLFAERKQKNSLQTAVLFIMQLTIIGLLLFLMLFEARSRYLFLYLPYFCILAANGYIAFISRIKNYKAVCKQTESKSVEK